MPLSDITLAEKRNGAGCSLRGVDFLSRKPVAERHDLKEKRP
jgi:hypothetical protein